MSNSQVDSEVAVMVIKRCDICCSEEGSHDIALWLLPENDHNLSVIKRYLFWHVVWRKLKTLGWILDMDGNNDHDFITIPPLPPPLGKMQRDVDFFDDEVRLMSVVASDPRFRNIQEIGLLVVEYDLYLFEFNQLSCPLRLCEQGLQLRRNHFGPSNIIRSNKDMMLYLDFRVKQRLKHDTPGNIALYSTKVKHQIAIGQKVEEGAKKSEGDIVESRIMKLIIAEQKQQQQLEEKQRQMLIIKNIQQEQQKLSLQVAKFEMSQRLYGTDRNNVIDLTKTLASETEGVKQVTSFPNIDPKLFRMGSMHELYRRSSKPHSDSGHLNELVRGLSLPLSIYNQSGSLSAETNRVQNSSEVNAYASPASSGKRKRL